MEPIGQNQSDDVMFGRVRQVAEPVGRRTALGAKFAIFDCLIDNEIILIGILFHDAWLCCIDFQDESFIPRWPYEGLVIIDFPRLYSERFAQFKQEMYDFYSKKYGKKATPIPDVSGDTVLCWSCDVVRYHAAYVLRNARCKGDM